MKQIPLEPRYTLVAQWETRGKDWMILYKHDVERLGERVGPFTIYGFRAGPSYWSGGISDDVGNIAVGLTDEKAIAEMERPWNGGGRPSAGEAHVMKCDRPSLKRVFPLEATGTKG